MERKNANDFIPDVENDYYRRGFMAAIHEYDYLSLLVMQTDREIRDELLICLQDAEKQLLVPDDSKNWLNYCHARIQCFRSLLSLFDRLENDDRFNPYRELDEHVGRVREALLTGDAIPKAVVPRGFRR